MRTPILLLAAVIALGACEVTQKQCLRTATHEIRTLDKLIAEAEANLARGYTYEERDVVRHRWQRCDNFGDVPGARRRMCLEPVFQTVKRPAAIDPQVEDRKLKAMQARRSALIPRAMTDIKTCRETYPDK